MNLDYSTNTTFCGRGIFARVTSLIFFLICPLAVSAQSYEQGREAYVNGDYERAFRIILPLARAGDSEAQKMMGIMYDYGHGVEADPVKSLDWYTRSAKQGQTAVQYQLGAKYFRGDGVEKNHQEAVKWWQMAADGGQVDAQFNLGLLYFRGSTIESNDEKAVQLFKQAARQGHSHAQYSLAVVYAFGRGVEKNNKLALGWFNKSAAQGLAQAQFNLGVFYENGYGVDKDNEEARLWYEKAAAQGLAEAENKLAQLQTAPAVKAAEPAQGQVASADYSLAEINPTGIKRENWVLQQRADNYTLQIGSLLDEQGIVDFIKSHHIESDAAYIAIIIKGEMRYNALYGLYENYDKAKQAIDTLPSSLRRTRPWVRNFGVLQGLLNQ